jgi:hypothetical protein
MTRKSLLDDLATVGVGIGLPATFVLGIALLGLTALTGRPPLWLAVPFTAVAIGSGISFVVVRRRSG